MNDLLKTILHRHLELRGGAYGPPGHVASSPCPREPNLLGTSTARAVVYSALTTIASFGTMGFASHMGLATLGRLLTLGVGFTILCNLVVLPSLIALRAPRPRAVGKAGLPSPPARSS